jgi:uncharacterized OsmC-like protein
MLLKILIAREVSMTDKFPLIFEVCSEAESSINAPWKVKHSEFEAITCCVPPELKGPGGGYTPEDLFALSIINCIISDFKVFCERDKESFEKIKIKASLKLDNHSNKKFTFTNIDIKIDVIGATSREKIEKILNDSIKHCTICNAIKVPKTFHINIS